MDGVKLLDKLTQKQKHLNRIIEHWNYIPMVL